MCASDGKSRIGVFVPFTNTNLEPDLAMMCPAGVSLHFARMAGYSDVDIPDEAAMERMGKNDISEPLRLLLGARPDLILYGCTSATLTNGLSFDRKFAERVASEAGVPVITAAGALVDTLANFGVRNVGFASPYVRAINDRAISFLREAGIEVVSRTDLAEALDSYGQGEMSPDQVFEIAQRANCAAAEAIVISCTDIRAVEIVDRLEAELQKPIVCTNQAMLNLALEHLGIAPAT